MEQLSFVFTIFFILLGPVKIIGPFAALTRAADTSFKRAVAVRAILGAALIVLMVALAGVSLLTKYRIAIDAVRLAGGLVLLITALNAMFPKPQAARADQAEPTALQVAVSPVATPIIVTPGGVAAILLCMLLAPEYPGMELAVGISLVVVMVLNFLVMYFIDQVTRTPGLTQGLQILGAVLGFMQVTLAVQTLLQGLQHLGAIPPQVG